MKILRKVRAIEVKRAFVIAQKMRLLRRRGERHLLKFSKASFLKKLRATKASVRALTDKQLNKIIAGEYGNRQRSDAYDHTTWYRATVSTGEVGVWRRARGLPAGWTCCSLKQTAVFVRAELERKSGQIRTRAKRAILGIMEFADVIENEKYLYPIVFMGGTGTCGRKWCKRRVRGDIDDGCARSIALAISGRNTLHVYFGKPSDERFP